MKLRAIAAVSLFSLTALGQPVPLPAPPAPPPTGAPAPAPVASAAAAPGAPAPAAVPAEPAPIGPAPLAPQPAPLPPATYGVAQGPAPSQPPPSAESRSRWWLGGATEAAFGQSGAGFYNHLVALRIERELTPTAWLGGSLSYVNLKGKEGRVSNALPLVSLEWRPEIVGSLGVPLQWSAGYLPKNGPVLRLASGLGLRASQGVDVRFEGGAMWWSTHDDSVLSLDLGLALSFGL